MALPAKAKIAALVCSGRSRPYDRYGMPAEQRREHQLERDDQADEERDDPPAGGRDREQPHDGVVVVERLDPRRGPPTENAWIRRDGHGYSLQRASGRVEGSSGCGTRRHAVVEQHADGRRAGVVELARRGPPRRTRHRNPAATTAARGDEQHDHAHAGSILRADQRIAPAAQADDGQRAHRHQNRGRERRQLSPAAPASRPTTL